MTTDSNPNPQPQVDTPPAQPPNPNPQPQVEPSKPPAQSSFDPDTFFSKLDEKLTGFGEQVVTGIREAFPAPSPAPAPTATPPKDDTPPKDTKPDAPKDDEPPKPGKKTFAQWWFGQ